MSMETILIVDDEKEMCHLIKSFLENERYQIYTAENADQAVLLLDSIKPDLIILDVMLPDMSGVDLCLQVRNELQCPILFLSCRSEEIDKIMALSAGGDDYITKPFDSGELIARVKAHLRRERRSKSTGESISKIYECKGLVLDEGSREVIMDGENIKLTSKEFDILLLLMQNPKRVFSMEQIFEQVWKEESLSGDSRTIMVYISNLRKKIEPKGREVKYITNVRSVGYKFHDHIIIR